MKKKDWVAQKLKSYSSKELQTRDFYNEYCEATDSDATFASYRRYVNIVATEETEEESGSPLPYLEDEPTLIMYLEDEVTARKQKLKHSDLAEIARREGFNPASFSRYVTDLNKVLRDIYRINSLEFENDIDTIKLHRKIKVLQSEVDELRNQHADYSQLVDLLEDVTEIYTPWEKPEFILPNRSKERAVVALYSDLHAGELVSLEETHGLNKYNQEIMKERIDRFFTQVVEYASEIGSNILYLKMLGDMVNGEIHEELIRNSDLDTTESLILVADYTAKWIHHISQYFSDIHIIALSGNHGRYSKKPNFKKKQALNFDYLAYEFIRREVKDIVSSFELPQSPFVIRNIYDFRFFTSHGDQFKGGTGLSPTSGTWGRDIEKLKGLFQSSGGFDYAEFAHFHTPHLDVPTFSGVSIIVNGAIKGADEFSIGAVKAGSRPSQVVYTVERGYGVKFRTTLYLD